MLKRYIIIKFEVPGIHRWKECPFEDVEFLKYWHRHVFHFEVKIQVLESDRDLEFIREKKVIQKQAEHILSVPVESSCETIAEEVLNFLKKEYGEEFEYSVCVMEDGENGGVIEYIP